MQAYWHCLCRGCSALGCMLQLNKTLVSPPPRWRCDVQLIESGKAEGVFPSDVIERAKHYLAAMPGGTGAYSDSRGAMVLRKDIAKVPTCCSEVTRLIFWL